MRLEVIPAMHVRVGDVVVGMVRPDAPTRPVQPIAHGLTVKHVSEVPAGVTTLHYSDDGAMMSEPIRASSPDRVMVIR